MAENRFELTIDPCWSTGNISLNGSPVYVLSPLSRCTISPLFDWIQDLPRLLYQEVNGVYRLRAHCGSLAAAALRGVFSGEADCAELVCEEQTERYTTKQRAVWAEEAAGAMGCTLPEKPCLTISAGAPLTPALRQALTRPEIRILPPGDRSGDLLIIRGDDEFHTRALCYLADEGPLRGERLNGRLIFRGSENHFPDFVSAYLDLMYLRPWLLDCCTVLEANLKGVDFLNRAKTAMLRQDCPVVRLTAPDRTESGVPFSYHVEEFPPSSLRLQAEPAGILGARKDRLVGLAPGKARLTLWSEQGEPLASHEIEVYRVRRVTDVTLAPEGGSRELLTGERIRILPSFVPADAENIALAQWSVSPPAALRAWGNGVFEAVNSGPCTVTVTVEGVSRGIDLTVYPQASDLRLQDRIRLKVGGGGEQPQGDLLPSGAACRKLVWRSLNPAVANWDSAAGRIVPVAEGTTSLEAAIQDAQGRTLAVRSCEVEVLPEKEIVTPKASHALLVLSWFFWVVSLIGPALPVACWVLAGCGLWAAVDCVRALVQKTASPGTPAWLILSLAAFLPGLLAIL